MAKKKQQKKKASSSMTPWLVGAAVVAAVGVGLALAKKVDGAKFTSVGSMATTAWFRPSDVIAPRSNRPYRRPNLLKILPAIHVGQDMRKK